MPRKKQKNIEQPELIAEEAAEYIVSPDEEALREEYRRRLAEMLKEPEFRKIEGFPVGEDEAILALSDPPYYTACPNPFLNEIVEKWQHERAVLRDELGLPNDEPVGSKFAVRENMPTKNYHREPFAADVSEGKNDPIYNAHSYHTKVPYKAIMRYILHYTDPGDVILDGFCSTGMTGVAAQLCGDKKTVESLGYSIKDGMAYDEKNNLVSGVGVRKAVLTDLSPAATFISYNYNTPINKKRFESAANKIIKEIELECGWMYETTHSDGKSKGNVNYVVWSDVFLCPNCAGEMIFWDVAVDEKNKVVHDNWHCPHCSTLIAKSPAKDSGAQKAERAWVTGFDRTLSRTVRLAKQTPVIINYSAVKKRYDKRPDNYDLALIQKIEESNLEYKFPFIELPKGDKTTDPASVGITNIHQFYTYRNLWVLAAINKKIQQTEDTPSRMAMWFAFSSALRYLSKMSKLGITYYFSKGGGVINSGISGTLFIPSFSAENNVIKTLKTRIPKLSRVFGQIKLDKRNICLQAQSSSVFSSLASNSIDYIFVDPPFGSNLMYSELNYLWDAWLGVLTNNQPEAIMNRSQRKGLFEYQALIENCFAEFFRVLKPGRWLTVEFHNSQNSVWNAIHEAITRGGFVVADVRTLDKKQGNFNQVNAAGAVKQDLIISAYKPTDEFEKRFTSEAGSEQGSWDFMRQHLEQLPLPNIKDGSLESLQERFPYLLYDRMVAFHIQRGLTVPLSAPEFYQGLSQRFLEREGMVFAAAQAAAYDKLRLQAERVEQLALFVTDESSARQWLRQELEHEPKTYGDLQPKFVQQLHQSKYEDLPELKVILEQAFLQDEKGRWYVPDPERAADLEKLRQNALLREFNEYRKGKGRLKVFRSEAVRAGFSNSWREREYDVIVEIAERMPESVLQEDQQLLMYYHNAGLRQSSQPKQEKLL